MAAKIKIKMAAIDEFVSYFLSHKDMWFNPQHKYDASMKKYQSLLTISPPSPLFIGSLKYDNTKQLKYLFKILIVFDQLPYYIYRNRLDIIHTYHSISIRISKFLLGCENIHTFFDTTEKTFILLALRHSIHVKDVRTSLDIIKTWREQEDLPIYKRFYRATLLKLSKFNNVSQFTYAYSQEHQVNKSILDKNSTFDGFENINDCSVDLQPYINKIIAFYSNTLYNYENIIVSLSGGVDSMLLLHLISKTNKNVRAIHINYMNRESSCDEADLCMLFCEYLKIPIIVRTITEIQRTRDKDRDIYEDITREIRFHMYSKLSNMFSKKAYIALGHNKDDCIENIFSNIIKQKKYDNLMGMEPVISEKNVLITRPFINIYKADIYDLAHRLKLPYAYDSTPSWCERGQKRDVLIPFLNRFDHRIISGLLELSHHTSQLYKIQEDSIIKNITFHEDGGNILCEFNPVIVEYDSTYFRNMMSYICKYKNIQYFSTKSILNFHARIKQGTKIILNKDYYYENYKIIKVM
jgi:tRNA(Ile)-lysidine synthetase-like protein